MPDASSFAQPELQNRFDLAGTPRDRRQSDTEIGNEDWLVEAPTTFQPWDYPFDDVWWWLYLLVSFLSLTLADWKLNDQAVECVPPTWVSTFPPTTLQGSPALMWFTISPSAQVAMGARGLSQFFGEREVFKSLDNDNFGGSHPTVHGYHGFWKRNLVAVLRFEHLSRRLQAWCHVARDSESLEGWLLGC